MLKLFTKYKSNYLKFKASEDLYGDLAGAPDLDDSMTGDALANT